MGGMPELLSIVLLGFWIYCLIDIATTDREQVRNLPKWVWFAIVFLLPPVGVILWWLLGRPPRAFSEGDRWEGRRYAASRSKQPRRSRPAPVERYDDEATIRARIEERDRLLARWAEEDRRGTTEDPPGLG